MGEQIEYAEMLARSGMVPKHFRNRPADVLWAIGYAAELGLGPVAAMQGITVINGVPSANAQLMGTLVRRAGHKLRVRATGTEAVAELIRADDPEHVFRVSWTLDDAARAGLCRLVDGQPIARDDKGRQLPWMSYPRAMLRARAISELCREAAQDALSGLIYTPEELGAVWVDEEGNLTNAPAAPAIEQQPAGPSAQDAADRAARATTAEEVSRLYRLAHGYGLLEAPVTAGGITGQLGDALIARGRALRAAEQRHQDDSESYADTEYDDH
ncbi:hypothetical protein [Kitasatospora sp. MAA4]|uniref:hypothetical protein n=1 Tax=Kitasatospora sp. MAA4 TaxID=3035093 RepID=UPI002473E400|nr:hypothetical protein [Kitasatospora sp. MAA4]